MDCGHGYVRAVDLLLVQLRPLLEPSLKGSLTLARTLPQDEVPHTDVLIEVWPMNPLAFSDQSPILTFRDAAVEEAGKPGQRHGKGTTIA